MKRFSLTVSFLGSLIALLYVGCVAAPPPAEMLREAEEYFRALERRASKNALIAPTAAASPIGYLILIRRDRGVCATRFTKFHRGNDAQTPSVFSSGEQSQYAEYEWHYLKDQSKDFSGSEIQSGHGVASYTAPYGIGRFTIGGYGARYIQCGPYRVSWYYPTTLGFKSGSTVYELAPTKWKELSEIDIRDPRIKWYGYDENRPDINVPVDQLW